MNYPTMTSAPSRTETLWGLIWLALSMILLPSALQLGNQLLAAPLSAGLLNVVYYCLNFGVTIWIFRKFLAESMTAALRRTFPVIWYAILGYMGYQLLTEMVTYGILMVYPAFSNVNDENIYTMLSQDFMPLAFATVFLVPLAEEVTYRGLIFRKLFDRNPLAAYLVSMAAFAAIHVVGYIGTYEPVKLLLCFIQYFPAGYCLCWCYRQTGTILSPILMHTLVNGTAIYFAARY